ncbi:MAG: hypothetical protein RJQ04_03080 [Longimicrobiales bacterium]
MSRPRVAAAWLVALGGMVAMAGLSRVPYAAHPDADAVLRLSWRIRGEALAECAALSPEELARLPVHMQNPEACQRRGRSYRLRAWIDGAPVVDRVMAPAGVRGDRPLYVFEEVSMPPGTHGARVTFEPVAVDYPAPSGESGLSWSGTLQVGPRGVALVTLDRDAAGVERLELRAEPPG